MIIVGSACPKRCSFDSLCKKKTRIMHTVQNNVLKVGIIDDMVQNMNQAKS